MATLLELSGVFKDVDLIKRITSAAIINAKDIVNDVNATSEQKRLAENTVSNSDAMGLIIAKHVIAANANADLATINAVSDTVIKNQVNATMASLVRT